MDKKDIKTVLSQVASLLGTKGNDTIMNKNFGKHLLELQLILRYCQKNAKILDVGGGAGINLLCLSKINKNLKLFLIDKFDEYTDKNPICSKDIGLQLQNDLGISTVIQDFWIQKKLPYASGSFDIVTAFDVIEHFPEPPFTLLNEMIRILKKGGTLIVSVPNLLSTARRGRFLLGRHPYMHFDEWISGNYFGHYRECTRKEWQIIIEKAGFDKIQTIMVNEPTKTKAINSYHFKKYNRLSLPAIGLWVLYFIDCIFPNLRTAIYCTAKKSK